MYQVSLELRKGGYPKNAKKATDLFMSPGIKRESSQIWLYPPNQ